MHKIQILVTRGNDRGKPVADGVGNSPVRPIDEIALDLASISFLDSDSVAVLHRLKRELGIKLNALPLFIGKVVETAEKMRESRIIGSTPDERIVDHLRNSRWLTTRTL